MTAGGLLRRSAKALFFWIISTIYRAPASVAKHLGRSPRCCCCVCSRLWAERRRSWISGGSARRRSIRERHPVTPIDRTWLTVALEETPSGITGACSYKNDLFEPNTLRHWIADYNTILAKAAANPVTSLGRLADR